MNENMSSNYLNLFVISSWSCRKCYYFYVNELNYFVGLYLNLPLVLWSCYCMRLCACRGIRKLTLVFIFRDGNLFALVCRTHMTCITVVSHSALFCLFLYLCSFLFQLNSTFYMQFRQRILFQSSTHLTLCMQSSWWLYRRTHKMWISCVE